MSALEYAIQLAYGPQLDWLGYILGMWLQSDFARAEHTQLETDVDYRDRLLGLARKLK
jgi:hypothetical protein